MLIATDHFDHPAMNPFQVCRIVPVTLLVMAGMPLSAFAQSSDASRYVNPQGVEVIGGRRSGPVEQGAVPVSRPALTPSASSAAKSGDSRLQVSPRQQSARDEDRLVILNSELKKEADAFETKLRIVQTPALKAKLSTDDLARVEAGLVDHERNVRSLNAEIGRVRIQR